MEQYIKKQKPVKAVQYTGTNNPFGLLATHQCDYRMCSLCGGDNKIHIYVKGRHDNRPFIKVDDWVLLDDDGIVEVWHPDRFEKYYEPATQPPSAPSGEEEFNGSRFQSPGPGITIGCISPEARDLLDTIMEKWEEHLKGLRETYKNYEATLYGFAYWLCRWSGLIQPAGAASTTQDAVFADSFETVFIACEENDQRQCGGYTSDDGQSLCHVREAKVPVVREGAVWVKTGERLPQEYGKVTWRWLDKEAAYSGYTERGFIYDRGGACVDPLYYGEIEWLDESTPSKESEAVELLQWAGEQHYKYFTGNWYKYGRLDHCAGTTEQLYTLFKQSKTANK